MTIDPNVDRRTLLKGGVAAAVGGPFAGLLAAPAEAHQPPRRQNLVPVKDLRDGKERLHLPRGFSYRSFHDTEATVTLDDGTMLPGRHDGMGAFRGRNGNVVLVRNHEITNQVAASAFGPGAPYDANAGAGTTTIEVTRYGEVQNAYTSLNGTMFNCSGGIMPWGSWVTCEETVNGPDVGPDFQGRTNEDLQQPHGYVFEVPAGGQSDRQPITHAGRFAHEAVSFDPKEGILYLTEDNFEFPSGFYRYIPPSAPDEDRASRGRRTAADARRQGSAQRASRGPAETAGDVQGDLGRHRRPEPRPERPARAAPDHQRRGAGGGRRPGPRPGGGAVLAARGSGLRRRRRLLHLHPGRRAGRGRHRRRQRQRLRPWQRPGVGLRLPLAAAAGDLPGAGGPGRGQPALRLPGQHHHEPPRARWSSARTP